MIGAGAAGLAAAAELGRRGISAVVIERADEIGASWQQRYDGLRLNTMRALSAPRHSRIPRSAGRWPTREAFVEHLRAYADHDGLEVELGTEVQRIDRTERGYALATSKGSRSHRFVVVATGYDHTPFIPKWTGRESFEGELIHATDYRNAERFREKDVLVVEPAIQAPRLPCSYTAQERHGLGYPCEHLPTSCPLNCLGSQSRCSLYSAKASPPPLSIGSAWSSSASPGAI